MNPDNELQHLWKQSSQAMPEPGTAEVCAMARRREAESVWGRRLVLFALAGLTLAFAHNALQMERSWVRFGQAWMLLVTSFSLWRLLRSHAHRRAIGDTCGGFLIRSTELKRDGYRTARTFVLLILPGAFASWKGGGAALKARALGLSPDSVYYQYLHSPWPTVATLTLLLTCWLAFNSAQRKAGVELESLRRRLAEA